MLRTLAGRPAARRRGAVLIVVLAMLVLFAVLGIGFVLYAESQNTAARSNALAANLDTTPDPLAAAELFSGALVYGPASADELHPLRGHDFASLKYGFDYANTTGSFTTPYAGDPSINPTAKGTNQSSVTWNMTLNERDVVNYTRVNTGGNDFFIFDPMRADAGSIRFANAAGGTANGTYRAYRNRAAAYTYADRTNFHLAVQDPTTGEIVLPSFHRPDLFTNTAAADPIAQSLNPNNPKWRNDTTTGRDPRGRLMTLRPRPGDHPNFPPVPMNPDGSYTGDVQNMKFTNGPQRNDSLWMYAGGPAFEWRGKRYTACVAPLILDLNGRVNLSVAGNLKQGQTLGGNNGTSGGSQGYGAWEIDAQQMGFSQPELLALIAKRQGGGNNPPRDPYTADAFTRRINGMGNPSTFAALPPGYSLIDFDGAGAGVGADPLTLPAAGGFSAFPNYPVTRFPATSTVAETSNHAAQFNPLVYPRGQTGRPGGFGHDDLVRLHGRYNDPKGRTTPTGVPVSATVAAPQSRALTTTHSVTQQWATVTVYSAPATPGNPPVPHTLGPVDVNRPLPDYRRNPALPLSPLNMWAPGTAQYTAAHAARHQLARDIFVRLCAVAGDINGTTASYNPTTGGIDWLVNPLTLGATLSQPDVTWRAQVAANIVDYIDNDDLITAFVWNPTPASQNSADPSLSDTNFATLADVRDRVVFGTELPRLVINEAYCCVANDRTEEAAAPPMNRSTKPLQRRYWIELHNPTPEEPAGSAARSELGAARLRYQPGVTPLNDPVSGAATVYPAAATDFNPYRLEVGEVPKGKNNGYTETLGTGRFGLSGVDTADAATFPDMTLKVRIDSYTYDATAPSAAPVLGAGSDELNRVRPNLGPACPSGRNEGYYLIGPRDQVPAGDVKNTMSLPDSGGTFPTNALTYPVGAGAAGNNQAITDEEEKWSVVILRRLVDPYRPQNDPSVTAGPFAYDATKPVNPFVTVDVQEDVPTRDRAKYHATGPHAQAGSFNEPSMGRRHPYAGFPIAYRLSKNGNGPNDQTHPTATPAHSFFTQNSAVDNDRAAPPGSGFPNKGYYWLCHPDRELTSLPELKHASNWPPALLTANVCSIDGYSQGYAGPLFLGLNTTIYRGGYRLLETGSRLPGVPLGGREPGRINLNTANSQAVITALFGSTAGNTFPGTQAASVWAALAPAVTPAYPDIARTPTRVGTTNVPRATTREGGSDRPFVWGGAAWTDTDAPDTRTARAAPNQPTVFGNPTFQYPNPIDYYRWPEPIQKTWNNITPVSDTFLVMMTVSFFEVENAGPLSAANPPVLGKELFDKVPGDLRAQFAGVFDRSQLATQIVQADAAGLASGTVNAVAGDPGTGGAPRGIQTKLLSNALPSAGPTTIDIEAIPPGGTRPDGTAVAAGTCAILGDGVVFTLNGANTRIRVGYGDSANGTGDGEWLSVTNVTQRTLPNANGVATAVPGQVTLTVSAVGRFHGSNSPVGNVLYGNPGPQTGVTLKQLQARGVVPYFTRLEP